MIDDCVLKVWLLRYWKLFKLLKTSKKMDGIYITYLKTVFETLYPLGENIGVNNIYTYDV